MTVNQLREALRKLAANGHGDEEIYLSNRHDAFPELRVAEPVDLVGVEHCVLAEPEQGFNFWLIEESESAVIAAQEAGERVERKVVIE